jgi:hypothetical protein
MCSKYPLSPTWLVVCVHHLYCAGTLPASWSVLSKLRECRIIATGVNGPLPASWSQMTAMQELWLYMNRLTGE